MSLRRSARISTASTTATAPDTKHVAKDEVKPEEPKTKARSKTKIPLPPKPEKRKTTASATTTTTTTNTNPTITTSSSAPQTPLPKKRKKASTATVQDPDSESPIKPTPFTPTPFAVSLIASSTIPSLQPTKGKGKGKTKPKPKTNSNSQENDHPLEDLASLTRPAEPHTTNALLVDPTTTTPDKSSQVNAVAAYAPTDTATAVPTPSPSKRKAKEVPPPDVGALPDPTSTIDTLLEDACAHLCSVDPRLKNLIEGHQCKMFTPEGLREVVDPFTALASGIIGQQVSGQAAASIRKKFTALFPTTHPAFPSPAQIIEKDLPTLRTAGLSQRKAEYIHGLAEKFASGELSAPMLVSASDEDLIEKLVAVRGLGRWSVEMFACFGLKRMDVFSTGDLGVQRGMATYVGKDVSKLKAKGGKWKYMSEKEMLELAARFSPYRSLFMWYMWRICDVDISVLQEG